MTTEVDLAVVAILEVVISTLVAVTTLPLVALTTSVLLPLPLVALTTSVLLPLPLLLVIGLLLLPQVAGDDSNDMWSGCSDYRGHFCYLFFDSPGSTVMAEWRMSKGL